MIRSLLVLSLLLLTCCAAQAQLDRKWATYYGRSPMGLGTKITSTVYDPSSNCIYVAGVTSDSTVIATPGSFRSTFHPQFLNTLAWETEIFLAKFDTSGNRIWATYYGSDGHKDEGANIAIDGNGFIYLAGLTSSSSGIATPGSYQPSNLGSYQVFLAKFNPAGQRIWGTYTLAPSNDAKEVFGAPVGLTVDKQNNVYISCSTGDTANIATPGTYQTVFNYTGPFSSPDAFIMKFNPNGQKLWGTYYGGTEWDGLSALCTDEDNNLYAWGITKSTSGIASPGADLTVLPYPQEYSAYLVKLTSSGQRLWATYIGGNTGSYANDIIVQRVNGSDNIYVTGVTNSTAGIATPGSYQPNFGGGNNDLFLLRYNAAGKKIWGTYYGGPSDDAASDQVANNNLALNGNNVMVVSATGSLSNIEKGCAAPTTFKDGFISKWNSSGDLLWGNYYDAPLYAITTAGTGKGFYVTGSSTRDGITTPNAHQATKIANKISGIIAKFTGDVCPPDTLLISLHQKVLHVDTGYVTYQWYHDGNLIPGVDSASYPPGQDTGTYFVIATNECGCIYRSEIFHVQPATGVYTLKGAALALDLYPNPNRGIFTLKGTLGQGVTGIAFAVTDLSGRVIKSGILAIRNGQLEQRFDITSLENGIYFIKLQSTEDSGSMKFVKY